MTKQTKVALAVVAFVVTAAVARRVGQFEAREQFETQGRYELQSQYSQRISVLEEQLNSAQQEVKNWQKNFKDGLEKSGTSNSRFYFQLGVARQHACDAHSKSACDDVREWDNYLTQQDKLYGSFAQ